MISTKYSEIIHVSSIFPIAFSSFYGAKRNGKKIVFYVDPPNQKESWMQKIASCGFLIRKWKKHCYEQGDLIITSSNHVKAVLEKCGVNKQIYVVPNGVDTTYFHPDFSIKKNLRKKLHVDDSQKIVLFQDDLSRKDRTQEYVRIMENLPDVLFIQIDQNSEGDRKYSAKRKAYETINLIKTVNGSHAEEVRAVCQGSDAFLSIEPGPSEEKVILEALSCGMPVAAMGEVLFDGILLDRKNAYQIDRNRNVPEELMRILYSDSSIICENARKFAKERDLSQIDKIMLQIYEIENIEDNDKESCKK